MVVMLESWMVVMHAFRRKGIRWGSCQMGCRQPRISIRAGSTHGADDHGELGRRALRPLLSRQLVA
jgi:hypothetical protein